MKRRVIITGGSKGIGKAIAERFAKEECDIYLLASNKKNLESTKFELQNKYKINVYYHAADLKTKIGCENGIKSVEKKFEIKECDLENESIPYSDNTFDFIYSKSVIEHVRNADNFVSESYRVLKPGGIAVFMTPDWGTQYKTFWDDYTHVILFNKAMFAIFLAEVIPPHFINFILKILP